MKNYKKFLEEVTIKGNPSIPGEEPGDDKRYLSDVENRAKARLNITNNDLRQGGRPSRKEMELGQRIMRLSQESLRYTEGKEEELSKLANDVFMNIYRELINRYEIEVDIKVVPPGSVNQWMDDCQCQPAAPPPMREIKDEDVKREIHKRKIANLVIQGEAKNTKHILHTDEVKDGLSEIYGEEIGEKVFKLWDEITKTADQLDWIIPTEVRAEMMEEHPEFMAGACFVDWKPKDKDEEEDQPEPEQEVDKEKSFFASLFGNNEEIKESTEETPIIRARGIDFPMLLHEAVKGLFEVLSLGGLPDDKKVADLALANTGMSDEPEDWKYGPELASDIRDFINKNEKVISQPNVREEVYKRLVDRNTMPTADFLKLIKGILSKTDEARKSVDKIIDEAIDTIKTYHDGMDQYNREMDQYKKDLEDWKSSEGSRDEDEDEISKLIKKSQEKENNSDYSTMSKSQLQNLIDDALDKGDIDTLKKIQPFLKESLLWRIYESEINKLIR